MPEANEYLLTGEQSLPPVLEGRVTPLIDSRAYFPALAAEIAGTGNSSDFIYLMGWSLDWLEKDFEHQQGNNISAGFKLIQSWESLPVGVPNDFYLNFIEILKDKSQAGVDVRILGWISFGSAGMVRAGTLSRVIGQNAGTIATIRALRQESTLAQKCCLNTLGHVVGSVHAKLVIVGTPDRTVAFTGGIDVAHGRHGSPPHERNVAEKIDYNGWHDVQAKVEGPVVAPLYDFFKDVWNELIKRPQIQLGVIPDTGATLVEFYNREAGTPVVEDRSWNLPILADYHPVQSLRTIPQSKYGTDSLLGRDPIGFAPSGVTEVRDAWQKAIQTAETYIYIEDQFLYGVEVYTWIGQALKNKSTLRVILVKGQPDPNDPEIFWPLTKKAFREGLKGSDLTQVQLNRLGFFVHQRATVHAKTTLIDDKWALIGSANFAQRSLYTDFEQCVGFADGARVREYRKALWKEHLCGEAGLSCMADSAVTLVSDDLSVSLASWDTHYEKSFNRLNITLEASGPILEVPGPLHYPPPGFAETWLEPDSSKEWNPCPH